LNAFLYGVCSELDSLWGLCGRFREEISNTSPKKNTLINLWSRKKSPCSAKPTQNSYSKKAFHINPHSKSLHTKKLTKYQITEQCICLTKKMEK
jgi:hypothetical protein